MKDANGAEVALGARVAVVSEGKPAVGTVWKVKTTQYLKRDGAWVDGRWVEGKITHQVTRCSMYVLMEGARYSKDDLRRFTPERVVVLP
jgi:hypothetical protein